MTALVTHEPSSASPAPDLPQLPDDEPARCLDDLSRWSARVLAPEEDWDAVRITGYQARVLGWVGVPCA